ncbi:MAG: 7-carboxy-7-deazaguanine synthase QueE [Candidatus Thorarchaeota archaeon]
MNDKLNVQAIFDSIDGEANGFSGAGQLTTFIRLKGCNLKCDYCDTEYSQSSEPENWMTVDEILQKIHFPKVTITGGEPLLQEVGLKELCRKLIYYRHNGVYHKVSIETNGSIVPTDFTHSLRYIVDFKLPSSGVIDKMDFAAFSTLRPVDVIKFVISDMEDYRAAKTLIFEHPNWKARKVFSPVMEIKEIPKVGASCMDAYPIENIVDTTWPRRLAEMMIRDRVGAQFSLQIHKILWPGAMEER